MQGSATKLRWLLLAGALALVAVVAGFLGLARYRAGTLWQRILARNGLHLKQETNGFTVSQSSGGRTIFTLHASRATPEGKNQWKLHDAVLLLYGREPNRTDRIYGREFEYDGNAGIARALGEVHLDLQAPEAHQAAGQVSPALGFGIDSESAASQIVHVRTSGLVYVRTLGIAATQELAEFQYGGLTCVSRGAEFDSGQGRVRLLADVHLEGELQGAPFALQAAHAELDRTAETATLTNALLQHAGDSARADHTLLHLRKDGTLAAAEADGAVTLKAGSRTVAAPHLTATFADANRPEHAHLQQGVTFVETMAVRPAQGRADVVDLQWDGAGVLKTATAMGAVHFTEQTAEGNGARAQRHFSADRALASFVPGQEPERTGHGGVKQALVLHGSLQQKRPEQRVGDRSALQRVDLIGAAHLVSEVQPIAAGAHPEVTAISADQLTTNFMPDATGSSAVRDLHGAGHTLVEQSGADGARRRSTGDTLQLAFAHTAASKNAANAAALASAVQTGNVAVESWTAPAGNGTQRTPERTSGHAVSATYLAANEIFTLEAGSAERATIDGSLGDLEAAHIVLHQSSGDAEASGGVVATSFARGGGEASHVQASRARLLHAAGLSQFFGEADHPARLWQGGSQVQAAELTLDNRQHSLAARPFDASGSVLAILTQANPAGNLPSPKLARAPVQGKAPRAMSHDAPGSVPTETEAGRRVTRVRAAKLDFDDVHHTVLFTGAVHLVAAWGDIEAERGVAFLLPTAQTASPATAAGTPNLGGSLERLVLSGNLQLHQPGRQGTGQQLLYTAATDSFVLTGSPGRPPRVLGEQGSLVTGPTLLYRGADSTIVVAGGAGEHSQGAPAGRVHTELDLKP